MPPNVGTTGTAEPLWAMTYSIKRLKLQDKTIMK
jgi:hypothetical protein